MNRKQKPLTNKAGEIRELTAADFRRMRPLRAVFPDLAAYSRTRAKTKEQMKKAVSLRLSPEVLAHFKATGPGWQTRLDGVLKAFVQAVQQ